VTSTRISAPTVQDEAEGIGIDLESERKAAKRGRKNAKAVPAPVALQMETASLNPAEFSIHHQHPTINVRQSEEDKAVLPHPNSQLHRLQTSSQTIGGVNGDSDRGRVNSSHAASRILPAGLPLSPIPYGSLHAPSANAENPAVSSVAVGHPTSLHNPPPAAKRRTSLKSTRELVAALTRVA